MADEGQAQPPMRMRPVAKRARDGRPDLQVGSPADAAEWLRAEIGTGQLAGMFQRGPGIVYLPMEGQDGYVPLTDTGHDGPAQIRPVGYDNLMSKVQFSYNCFQINYHTDKKGRTTEEEVACMFPKTAAQTVTASLDRQPNLRLLRGVTHTPIVRRDGSILNTPGYDEETRLYYMPDLELAVPEVSEVPTDEETDTAQELIETMIAEFKFASEYDRANYIGLLLTPLLRELCPPPYKLGAFNAHQQGSGKSLLNSTIRIVHGGVFRPEMPEGEEFHKEISTILDVTTGPVVTFDNVSKTLSGSHLSSLLTSTRWEKRRLGGHQEVNSPNDRLWTVNGNNIRVGGDNARRTLWVTIAPDCPNPHLRTGFKIPDLEGWTRDNRGRIIHALLTIVRTWVANGRDIPESRGSDNYRVWIETVNAILKLVGWADFDHKESIKQEVGSEDSDWEGWLATSYAAFAGTPTTCNEWLRLVEDNEGFGNRQPKPIPIESMPGLLAEDAARSRNLLALSTKLGRWCLNREGRWCGDYRIVKEGQNRNKVVLWRIEKLDTAEAPIPPPSQLRPVV